MVPVCHHNAAPLINIIIVILFDPPSRSMLTLLAYTPWKMGQMTQIVSGTLEKAPDPYRRSHMVVQVFVPMFMRM
jgi:hypothetical protein